ncbi:MAG: calcium-binding protein [Exiguobacterium profundum]|nr:MAG: calcium-binding protein [Exiguobacterium profundum]
MDTVNTKLSVYALGANVEDMNYLGTVGARLWGNGLSNHIFAAGGADTIFGGDGADMLYGQGGKDALYGGNQADYLFGGAAADYLAGTEAISTFWAIWAIRRETCWSKPRARVSIPSARRAGVMPHRPARRARRITSRCPRTSRRCQSLAISAFC